MPKIDRLGLRAVLVIAALVVAYTGVDNAFGGVATLGLQGSTDFIAVTDADAFAARDSHVRFLGGVWLGAAFVFAAGGVWLTRLRAAIVTVCALAFVGGLARFTSLGPAEIIANGLAAPLLAELIVLPLLALWTTRSTSSRPPFNARAAIA